MPAAAVRLHWVALVVVAACNGDKSDTTGTRETDEPEIETADTATEPEPDLTGNAGSIALVHWSPDAFNTDEAYFAVGLFVEDDFGIDNLASCLFASVQCVDAYPAIGDPGALAVDGLIYQE